MKGIYRIIAVITLAFAAAGLIAVLLINTHNNKNDGIRNVIINRIAHDVTEEILGGRVYTAGDEYLYDKASLISEYGRDMVPEKVIFIGAGEEAQEDSLLEVFSSLSLVRADDGTLIGALGFIFNDDNIRFERGMAILCLVISYFAFIIFSIYIYKRILRPAELLSDYPEKIIRQQLSEAIPREKNSYYDRYIWGLNLLRDEVRAKDEKIIAMERNRRTELTAIAHGIKTPLSNISLYAEAIKTGLYRKGQIPDEDDALVAEKIIKNTADARNQLKKILEDTAKPVVEYHPDIAEFYLGELSELTEKEFGGRLELLHIPFSVECFNNPLITSDRNCIFFIIAQLLENAIKYGSGEKISVAMQKQDDDIYISIKNKGITLKKDEVPYVFGCYWRGSNAEGVEGQGIGLYEAKERVRNIYGDLTMKIWEKDDETEFVMIFPCRISIK